MAGKGDAIMMDLLIGLAGVVLLVVAWALYGRFREAAALRRIRRSGRDPSAVTAAIGIAIEDEKRRAAEWRRQNPRL